MFARVFSETKPHSEVSVDVFFKNNTDQVLRAGSRLAARWRGELSSAGWS